MRIALFSILILVLVHAPASAQIVITGVDDSGEETIISSGDDATEADEKKQEEGAKGDAEAEGVGPPVVQIDGLDVTDAPTEEDESASTDEENDQAEEPVPAVPLATARQAMESAIRDRLTRCVSETNQPEKHGLEGAWVVQRTETEEVAVEPRGVAFSEEMFRNSFESPDDELLTEDFAARRRAFEECIADITVVLDGALPVAELHLQSNLVWFNDAALFRDVSWKEVPLSDPSSDETP